MKLVFYGFGLCGSCVCGFDVGTYGYSEDDVVIWGCSCGCKTCDCGCSILCLFLSKKDKL